MKNIVFFLALALSSTAFSQDLDLMSFNIRFDNPNDGEDRWDERKEEVLSLINTYSPDVIGLQEVLFSQIQYIDSLMPNFTYIGVGRDDGKEAGEFSPIIYDSTKLELMDQGTFWLSTTPDSVSTGWDAALPRVSTFGIFKAKQTDQLISIYNTHFDHVGEIARVSSAATIVQHIYKNNISESPVILMGDLNASPSEQPIVLIKNHFVDTMEGSIQGTFWGFDPSAQADRRIDYIFTKDIDFTNSMIIDDLRSNGRHISDHLPVMITVSLKE